MSMTVALCVLGGVSLCVGAAVVLIAAYRKRPAQPEATPESLMVAQERERLLGREAGGEAKSADRAKQHVS